MPFDKQPVLLKGKLVELRPLRSGDHDCLFAVAGDPLIWEQHPDKNRHEGAAFREFFGEAMASGGALLAIDAETKRVIGLHASMATAAKEARSVGHFWRGPTGAECTTGS